MSPSSSITSRPWSGWGSVSSLSSVMSTHRFVRTMRRSAPASLVDAVLLKPECSDRVSPSQEIELFCRQFSLLGDQFQNVARVRKGRVGVRVIRFEADPAHPDRLSILQTRLVVEDA